MKKIYALLILITSFTINLIAQPSFTVAQWPSAGTVVTSYGLDTTGITEGSAGANQTWDFSAATSSGGSFITQIVTPASTPYYSSYPSATSAAISPSQTSSAYGYSYYDVNSSFIDMIGFVDDDGAGTVIDMNYSDRRRVVNFPFTYNSTFTDTYSAIANYMISGIPYTDYRSGTATVTADAYGTVMTPGGTYTNALRIHTVETIQDSINIFGTPFLTIVDIDAYSWSDPSSIQTIMGISHVTTNSNGSISSSTTAQYSSISTGVKELLSMKPLALYPNPTALSTIHLNADDLKAGMVKFIVTDINGKEVKNLDFVIKDAARKTIDVEMTDCLPGIYLVQLHQNDAVYSSKFVKL